MDLEKLIGEYVALRDRKKQVTEQFAAAVKAEMSNRMEEIEREIGDHFKQTNQTNAKTAAGTAMQKTWTSVTMANGDEFRRHVIGTQQWELNDWKPNKTAVVALVRNGAGAPPGVNYEEGYEIQIRRPSE